MQKEKKMKKKIDNVLRVLWLLVFPMVMSIWQLMIFFYEIDVFELRWCTDELYLLLCSFIPTIWLLGFTINTVICFYKDFKRRKKQ